MNQDTHMTYERVVLAAWGEHDQWADPLESGAAGVLSGVDNELKNDHGSLAKLGLSSALRKVAKDQGDGDIATELRDLSIMVFNAADYSSFVKHLRHAEEIFRRLELMT